jgi:hypothetical protein
VWKKIIEAVDGFKTYIILLLLAAVSFYNGTAGSLDVTALLNNSDLLEQELVLALIAAGRSAVAKLTPGS